jgi:hypothetical protein
MRQQPRVRYFFTLALVIASPGAMAWGALGHRLVGDLAERHLQPSTERAVRDLLAGESEPTLAGVANWADSLRANDPDRFRQTSRWHYVNLPENSCRYDMARDCADGQCVVEAIKTQRTILADRSQPLEARRDALKFLVHLVGDVHQPLHAGNHDDKGGNKYQVSLRTDVAPEAYARNRYSNGVMGTNLHAVWDYYILASANLVEAQYANRLAGIPWPSRATAVGDPAAWASESCGVVDAHGLYPAMHIMDRSYLDAQRPLAEQRIRLAAYRLGRLLDGALGGQK